MRCLAFVPAVLNSILFVPAGAESENTHCSLPVVLGWCCSSSHGCVCAWQCALLVLGRSTGTENPVLLHRCSREISRGETPELQAGCGQLLTLNGHRISVVWLGRDLKDIAMYPMLKKHNRKTWNISLKI